MARPDRATFRLPGWALLLPIMLLFLVTPLATVHPAWGVLFVVPVVALVWVLITRTTATGSRLTTYGLLGRRRMAWTELDRLEVQDSRWVVAVGVASEDNEGTRLRLPMVRPHDLRRLIDVSGGNLRVGDPATEQDAEPAAPEPESQPESDPTAHAQPSVPDSAPSDAPQVAATSDGRVAEQAPTGP